MTLRIEKGKCKYTFLISLAAFKISFRFCSVYLFVIFMYIYLALTMRVVFTVICVICSVFIVNIRYIWILSPCGSLQMISYPSKFLLNRGNMDPG